MKRKVVSISIVAGLISIILILTACMITVEMEGDYVKPDSIRMTIAIEMNGERSPEIEVVKIGEDIYVKDPESQQWMTEEYVEVYQEYKGLEEFALSSIKFITAFQGTDILNDEEISGIPCFHIKGIIDTTAIEDLSPDLVPTETGFTNAELWIDKENYLVHQMVLEFEMEDTSPDEEIPISGGGLSFTFQFTKFNELINIEAPELAD